VPLTLLQQVLICSKSTGRVVIKAVTLLWSSLRLRGAINALTPFDFGYLLCAPRWSFHEIKVLWPFDFEI